MRRSPLKLALATLLGIALVGVGFPADARSKSSGRGASRSAGQRSAAVRSGSHRAVRRAPAARATRSTGARSTSGSRNYAVARSSTGGRTGTATRSSGSSSARSPSASGVTRASGKATYGYYRGGHQGGGYYGGHRYYGYYPYWGWYWGYPYYNWNWWWYPSPGPVYIDMTAAADARARAPGTVELKVKPKKAEVYIDGESRGQARDFNGKWDVLYVPPGTRTVELRHDGYKTLRLVLEIEPGGYYTVSEHLEQGTGLDARSMDPPPVEETTDVAARPPDMEFALQDEQPQPRSSLRRGLLRINASPPDAAVYLDGEFLASANELARLHGAIPVAEGTHVIEVVRPGFEAESQQIFVGTDQPVRVRLDLRSSGN